jgi:asparagine synthase (glutamine-hydrolysing)
MVARMCGIVGFWHPSSSLGSDALSDLVRKMASTIDHRGPDGDGAWVDPAAGIALGHRRLAIIDLSAAAAQPMQSGNGRFVITFNGEIYNYAGLRAELEASGRRFRTHSDTEMMLEAFDAWGIERALNRFIGMFAIALWDRRERRLTLIRDRMGVKPLYWGRHGDVLFFGSQPKSFRPHPGWNPAIDPDAIAACLAFNYIPAPLSVWRGIRKLRPGHFVTLDLEGHAEETRYWDLRGAARAGADHRLGADPRAAETQLHDLLSDAVKWRLVADVPVGAFLSGGIDSSTVVALMQRHSSRPAKTFSIGFREASYDEAGHARAVARHLGTDHTELYVEPAEAQAVIPTLPEFYDEPFADASEIPTLLVSRLARQAVTVSLSGDGGDEAFAGYTRYRLAGRLNRMLSLLPRSLRSGLGKSILGISPAIWDRLFAVLPESRRPRLPGDRLHKFARVLDFADADDLNARLIRQWTRPPAAAPVPKAPAHAELDQEFDRAVSAPLDRWQLADMLTYLPDDILVKLDRASMAASLEGREPLLDHRVIEFAWRLPPRLRIAKGQGKWLLRRVLDRYVPRALVERPKMGFAVPIDTWLRGPLRDWAEDLLSEHSIKSAGLLDAAPVRQRLAEHQSGLRNWQYPLWGALMIQAWHRRWA